jgi:tetratricopeptide (TPR) repeat protein
VAIERMEKIITDYPHFKTIWNLAYIYQARGKISQDENDFLQAEKYFRETAKISPQMAKIYSDWAQLKIEQKKWEEALEKCRQAISLYPQIPRKTPLVRELELKKEMARVYEQAGEIYFNLKNYSKSEEMYVQSLKLDPLNRPNLWKKIADIYYQQGDFEAAIDRNLHGSVLSPQDEAWPLAIALLYYEKEKNETGLGEIDFNDIENQSFSDNLIKSQKYFQKVLELDPENQTALQFLGPDPKN